jgi:hypothetical protein
VLATSAVQTAKGNVLAWPYSLDALALAEVVALDWTQRQKQQQQQRQRQAQAQAQQQRRA